MINGYLQKNHDIQIEQLATYYLLVLRFQYFSIEYITHLDWRECNLNSVWFLFY